MLRKSIGIFISAMIGFLLIAVVGVYWAFRVVKWTVPPNEIVTLSPVASQQTVKVYFGNNNLNKEMMDCSLVYPTSREIDKTQAVGHAALVELLKGPSADESNGGYITLINQGVKINSLTIIDGVARVDFDAKMGEAVGGSCRVSGIRAQIIQTLMQFPTVQSVIISVEGNSEEALQP